LIDVDIVYRLASMYEASLYIGDHLFNVRALLFARALGREEGRDPSTSQLLALGREPLTSLRMTELWGTATAVGRPGSGDDNAVGNNKALKGKNSGEDRGKRD
jgi:hypothetical protein